MYTHACQTQYMHTFKCYHQDYFLLRSPTLFFSPHAAPGTIIFVEPEFLRICFG